MNLAKNHIDLGLFATNIDVDRRFWASTIGLPFDHSLELSEPIVPKPMTQFRHDANGSVIKLNHFHGELPYKAKEPSGYKGLAIARNVEKEIIYKTRTDEFVRIVPRGVDQLIGIGITIHSERPNRLLDFYLKTMGFESIGPSTARCGDTLLFIEKGHGGTRTSTFAGEGFRYLTIQVYDADKTCVEIKERGGQIGMQPISVGKIARVGFVLDPDGNWIEISARASLTGIAPK